LGRLLDGEHRQLVRAGAGRVQDGPVRAGERALYAGSERDDGHRGRLDPPREQDGGPERHVQRRRRQDRQGGPVPRAGVRQVQLRAPAGRPVSRRIERRSPAASIEVIVMSGSTGFSIPVRRSLAAAVAALTCLALAGPVGAQKKSSPPKKGAAPAAPAAAPAAPKTRKEHDLLGDKEVPADAYYGVQTARALENFQLSGIPIDHYPGYVEAWAIVKLAAARANTAVGAMKPERLAMIEKACQAVRDGKDHDQ